MVSKRISGNWGLVRKIEKPRQNPEPEPLPLVQCNLCSRVHNKVNCPTCSAVKRRLGWGGERNTAMRAKARGIKCTLYLMQNNKFLKIGHSKNFKARAKQLFRDANLKPFRSWETTLWRAIILEEYILEKYKKHTAEYKFDGYTELKRLNDKYKITKEIREFFLDPNNYINREIEI